MTKGGPSSRARARRLPSLVRIRKAKPSDSAQLIDIASWWPVGSRIVPLNAPGCVVDDGSARHLSDPGWCVLVAIDPARNRIIGYAAGYDLTAESRRFGFD